MRKKKVVNIIVNTIVAVVFVIVAILMVSILTSKNKGYTSIFGTAYVAVETNSMDGELPDSFQKGDLILVKILKDEDAKKSLKKNDIISFYDEELQAINTHRIVSEGYNDAGVTGYQTKGDAVIGTDKSLVKAENVVGIYTGKKVSNIGHFFLFLNSKTGFFCLVVLPSLLLVALCVFEVVRTVMQRNRELAVGDKEKVRESILADEKERMRAELLKEMGIADDAASRTVDESPSSKVDAATAVTIEPSVEQGETAQAVATDDAATEVAAEPIADKHKTPRKKKPADKA